MPNRNERRWSRDDENAAYGERGSPRGWNHDDPREDIHQGPWSPYNGLARDRDRRDRDDRGGWNTRGRDDRGSWDTRGRDYWLEDDRWEDPRMGMGDQWRHRRDDRDEGGHYGDEDWGNRMGMREEPSERPVPRAGAWEHEPRYGEMERMWSDRDDHPWPGERRASDAERREHRDYAHERRPREHRGDLYARDSHTREYRDDYARERGGEQYPRQSQGSWQDDRYRGWRDEEPRNWTDRAYREEPRQGRDDRRFEREDQRHREDRMRHEERMRAGREEQRLRDEQRFGHQEGDWARRTYQRGDESRERDDQRYRDERSMQQHRDDEQRHRRDRHR